MALEHAILVSLTEQSATGFALAKRFDASIGNFWRASHQQIYRTLARMETAGQVSIVEHGREKVCSITDAGRAELAAWCATPSPREPMRNEFLVKLRAFTNPDTVRADTKRRLADHEQQLGRYLASEKRNYPEPDRLDGAELGSWLALRAGIRHETEGITFCREILSELDARTARSESR